MFPNFDPTLLNFGGTSGPRRESIALIKDLGQGSVLVHSGRSFHCLVVLGMKDC